jgi:hypothetical protein
MRVGGFFSGIIVFVENTKGVANPTWKGIKLNLQVAIFGWFSIFEPPTII